jgi:hypothetical protein
MKVFKFNSGDLHYAYSGETEDEAKEQLFEDFGEMTVDSVEEIPESKWDEKIINIWEDNDFEKEPYQVSIREIISNSPTLIFTNDMSDF